MKKSSRNKWIISLATMFHKLPIYFSCLSLFFLVSCGALNIINFDETTITQDDFTISTTSVSKRIGYSDTSYGEVILNNGITASFSISNSSAPNQIVIDENTGVITVSNGLAVNTYTFQVVVRGTGGYDGLVPSGTLFLIIEPHPGNLINVDNIDNVIPPSTFADVGLATSKIGNLNYLFITSTDKNSLEMFSINNNGELNSVTNVVDTPNIELLGANDVTTATIANNDYVFVAGRFDSGISTFRIDNNALQHVAKIEDSGNNILTLVKEITTTQFEGTTYLFAGAVNAAFPGVLSMYKVEDDGQPTSLINRTISSDIDGVSKIAVAEVNGTTYLFLAGRDNDRLSVYQIDTNIATGQGRVSSIYGISDTDTNTSGSDFKLDAINDLTIIKKNGIAYLFTAAIADSGISTFKIANDGSGILEHINSIEDSDNADFNLAAINAITSAEVNGNTYVIAVSPSDNGITMFSIGDDEKLYNTTNVKDSDDASFQLAGASSITTAEVNGNTYVFVVGRSDGGISVFRIDAN